MMRWLISTTPAAFPLLRKDLCQFVGRNRIVGYDFVFEEVHSRDNDLNTLILMKLKPGIDH